MDTKDIVSIIEAERRDDFLRENEKGIRVLTLIYDIYDELPT